MAVSLSPVVPLKDAPREYGVSRRTLYRLIQRGRLVKFWREGDRRTYLKREQLEAALGFKPKH